jgi:hypothetical protein
MSWLNRSPIGMLPPHKIENLNNALRVALDLPD